MLRIAICEDAPSDIAYIRLLLDRYIRNCPHLEIRYQYFESGKELLDVTAQQQEFDIYLLDILLPDMDGITLARSLNGIGKPRTIIFMTISRDYALEAFSVRAAHYLLKPVRYEAFAEAINEVIEAMGKRVETYITVATPQGDRQVGLSEIVFVEVTGHVFHYHLHGGETMKSKVLRISFEEALGTLREDWRFLRPHQSFLINASHVAQYTAREFIMDDGTCIPISRLRTFEVRGAYMDYLNMRSTGNGTV